MSEWGNKKVQRWGESTMDDAMYISSEISKKSKLWF